MRRRLFTFLSALSLVLFVGVCVLWVRSFQTADFVRSYRPDVATARFAGDSLCSTKGRLVFSQTRVEFEGSESAASYAATIFDSPNSHPGLAYHTIDAFWYPPRQPTF